MSLEDFILPELVDLAKRIIERKGTEGLENYTVYLGACGCMGPQRGEVLCPCRQAMALKTNLVEVVSAFDEDLAKKIMLRQIVRCLPG